MLSVLGVINVVVAFVSMTKSYNSMSSSMFNVISVYFDCGFLLMFLSCCSGIVIVKFLYFVIYVFVKRLTSSFFFR